jgi:hypothetical protein
MGLKKDGYNLKLNLQRDLIVEDISLVYFYCWKGDSSEEQLLENMNALIKNANDPDFKQIYGVMRVDLGVLCNFRAKVFFFNFSYLIIIGDDHTNV